MKHPEYLIILLLLVLSATALKAAPENISEGRKQSLDELRIVLKEAYQLRDQEWRQHMDEYEANHNELLESIAVYEDLGMTLYNHDQEFTLSYSWLLMEAEARYADFLNKMKDQDRLFRNLDVEIERYSRLIESLNLRQVSPDMEACRDSCLEYAAGILAMHTAMRDTLASDRQLHGQYAERFKETDDYVHERFAAIQDYVFKEGQDDWLHILSDSKAFMNEVKYDFKHQYGIDELQHKTGNYEGTEEEWNRIRGENTVLLYGGIVLALLFLFYCGICILVFLLIARIFKFGRTMSSSQKVIWGVLAGCAVFLFRYYLKKPSDDIFIQGAWHIFKNFTWLLAFILTSILARVRQQNLRETCRLYTPTIALALIVFVFRIAFLPDKFLTLVLAPILVIAFIRQLVVCIHYRNRGVGRTDLVLGWLSWGVTSVALCVALAGYTFTALLILTWWYIQLAIVLAVFCISHLIARYREVRVKPRIDKYHTRMARLTGLDKDSLLFGFTWFYDLVVEVVLPVIALLSLPFCLHLTLDIFNFDSLFHNIFFNPFVNLTDKDGMSLFRVSFRILLFLAILFFVFRYLNKTIHSLWQGYRYHVFRRKSKRMTVRSNEINLSLDNSVISVLVWFLYCVIVVVTLRIPITSLSLVAGGLSAGIGLALKDTINNFIYGIQLMSGRMRVGDYIECDGIRGKVTAISYQYTQLSTLDGNLIVFTNSALFNKNFKNLSSGSSYEYLKIPVTIGYDNDVEHVRALLLDAMNTLKTKDRFNRDIVDPRGGIKVAIDDMGESGLEFAIKQSVLVEERSSYLAKAKEIIYKVLNDNDIDIPYQQIEVLVHQKD